MVYSSFFNDFNGFKVICSNWDLGLRIDLNLATMKIV